MNLHYRHYHNHRHDATMRTIIYIHPSCILFFLSLIVLSLVCLFQRNERQKRSNSDVSTPRRPFSHEKASKKESDRSTKETAEDAWKVVITPAASTLQDRIYGRLEDESDGLEALSLHRCIVEVRPYIPIAVCMYMHTSLYRLCCMIAICMYMHTLFCTQSYNNTLLYHEYSFL